MKPTRPLKETCAPPGRQSSPAFLLAQVGSHAASKFAERLTGLNLAPPHAGILRILGAKAGITQQALAAALGMVPSRLVALLDDLEARGLTERRENPEDRRRYALHLTEKGQATLKAIGEIARKHQRVLLAALSEHEQRQLSAFLQRIGDEQGLTRGVHPGYKKLRSSTGNEKIDRNT
jgi:DNA-binding MarR family transcriptional regulator